MDYVTVLTCASDKFATKQRIWMESAQQWHTISYDKAYWFGYGRAEVDGIIGKVLRTGELYELRDTTGKPITTAEGRAIIAEQFSIPAEIRNARRRYRAENLS